MKLNKFTAGLALTALSLSAVASSPHFVKGPSAALTSAGDYVVSFKEVGLGNSPITYLLSASQAEFTFQCYNPSGNTPMGDPNGVSVSGATSYVTMNPRNGQITGSVTLSPEQDGASCQGKAMKLCLVAVSYKGVEFSDTTTPLGPYSMPDLSMTLSKPDCSY